MTAPVLARRPPRLIVKTLAVTFVTVFLLLRHRLRRRQRQRQRSGAAVGDRNLESSQRMFAALETRRQRELVAQASALAENPTLKAALDTYQAEARTSSDAVKAQLLATIDGELKKVAASVESDAVVLVDMHQNTLAAAGRMGERFPRGRPVALSVSAGRHASTASRGWAARVFRVVAVPLQFGDGTTVGTLYLATSLDARYAEELARLAGTHTAIISDGLMVASTLPPGAAREFEAAVAATPAAIAGTISLNGESYAFRRLVARRRHLVLRARVDRRVVARRDAPGDGQPGAHRGGRDRAGAGRQPHAGAAAVASRSAGSSTSLARMAASHDVTTRLPLTGSSRGDRRAHRDVQRPDGVGGARRSADRSGVHRRDPRARDRARRARSLHRRPFRSRQRAVGGDRPRARRSRPTISRWSGSARCSTTSARSACPTMCCESRGR